MTENKGNSTLGLHKALAENSRNSSYGIKNEKTILRTRDKIDVRKYFATRCSTNKLIKARQVKILLHLECFTSSTVWINNLCSNITHVTLEM